MQPGVGGNPNGQAHLYEHARMQCRERPGMQVMLRMFKSKRAAQSAIANYKKRKLWKEFRFEITDSLRYERGYPSSRVVYISYGEESDSA